MQKESKYTRRERLKRMGIIEVNGIQKEIKNVNKELISSIDNNEFWEDMENLIKEGANPNIKNEKGYTIFIGLEKIFTAWAEMTFDRCTRWETEEEKRRISYIIERLDFIKGKCPEIDIDGECLHGTFLNLVAQESRRLRDPMLFSSLFKKLLEYGADIYSEKGFRKPIQWLERVNLPLEHPLAEIVMERQKEILNKELKDTTIDNNKKNRL